VSAADGQSPDGHSSDDEGAEIADDEFVEDLAPDSVDHDYIRVSPERAFRLSRPREYNKDHHDAVTRRIIAFWVLTIVSVLYLLAVVGMICHWINVEELGRIALVLGPIQALAAAVLGFYFGRQHSS
jgi:hypothetical protein